MISYDDIVKAGSNIGGWEGKRGFYAVERYYEMAEKLRVQGYEKLQAGDHRNALIMLLKFAKLFEEIQKQPKLDKSSAGFKKVGRDMLKAMGHMEELKPKVQRELGMHTAAAAAVATAAAATAVADADVDDITAQLERRLKALQPAPAPAPAPSPSPRRRRRRPRRATGADGLGRARADRRRRRRRRAGRRAAERRVVAAAPAGVDGRAVGLRRAGRRAAVGRRRGAGPVEAACTIPGGVAPPLTSAASSGLAHIGATAASGLGAMAAAAAALPDPNSPARPARSASDGPAAGIPVAPAGARGARRRPTRRPMGRHRRTTANTMYPKVARPLSELPGAPSPSADRRRAPPSAAPPPPAAAARTRGRSA